jgi:succinate dehydrogenase / fumarate reductase cytochrome b subunit
LIEHLFVNSQAALWIGENGQGFVRAVNSIHDLPYLAAIEFFFLAVPIAIHMGWGIRYLFTGEANSYGRWYGGAKPYLPQYPRNHAYSWQRITSWVLAFGIIAHVVHMRFIEYPVSVQMGTGKSFMVRLNDDPGLETLSAKLGFEIYDKAKIEQKKKALSQTFEGYSKLPPRLRALEQQESLEWLKALQKHPLQDGQVIAVANRFGIVELLMVRDTFKMPVMLALYTLFVLAACFHAFNGLWTFMISWGVTLTARSQTLMLRFAYGLMVLIAFLGLAAIWGTYWINLKQ